MYTKRKGIKSKKHRHSAHHRRSVRNKHNSFNKHKHSIHHRKRSSTKRKHNKRKTKTKTRRMRRKRMSGGMADYQNAYIPDATESFNNGLRNLGESYNPAITNTPSGNHYAYNTNVKAAPIPSNHNAQIGGRKHKCKCRGKCKCKNKHFRQNGGGISSFMTSILPEELVNVGRSVPSAFGHLADKFNGELSHPSSRVYPTEQPHVDDGSNRGSLINPNTMSMSDIRGIYNEQNNIVSGI